jgi:hypothetical protein
MMGELGFPGHDGFARIRRRRHGYPVLCAGHGGNFSKVDNSCSVIMSVNNSLVCWGIGIRHRRTKTANTCPNSPPANGSAPSASPNPKPAAMPPASAPPPWTWATTTCSTAPKTGSPTAATSKVAPRDGPNPPGKRPPRHQLPDRGSRLARRAIGAKEDKLGIRSSDTTPSCTRCESAQGKPHR